MPIREYRCSTCDHTTEKWFRNQTSVTQTTPCEQCAQPASIVEISNSNFHLMGEGWYKPSWLNRNYKPLSET